ncbi:MAG TPA: hypothetical protein VJC05_01290 [Candidatus Andersenbacteria bacterium]|nr:hypothetical protein [Candidatus Andersenbacteria bacterium]
MRRHILFFIFTLFLIANTVYLHRVPGLFGDEASEGENVYQLRWHDRITVIGERSYIGPLIDYVRTPFVLALGYNALALRLAMLLFSLATFMLAAVGLRRMFGETAGMYALVMMVFSPTYLLKQRLGWAITLFPFFAFLLLYFLTDKRFRASTRAVWAGLAAGLGLHNYIVFLPTIVGIMGPAVALHMRRPRALLGWWLMPLSFWAAFGTQFAVLQIFPEDQGNPREVIALAGERLAQLPDVLPKVLSGSVYVARYTGVQFAAGTTWLLTSVLGLLVVVALLSDKKRAAWLWLAGLVIQLLFLILMVDRFTLRYLVVFVLGVWALAGVGLGMLVQVALFRRASLTPAFAKASAGKPDIALSEKPGLPSEAHRAKLGVSPARRGAALLPVILALVLMAWTGSSVLVPYLETGGSGEKFNLGTSVDSAIDMVDIRPLVACVREAGPVWADNPHVYNRLLYLSRGDKQIHLPLDLNEANWIVDYRLPGQKPGVKCPELEHFRLVKRK